MSSLCASQKRRTCSRAGCDAPVKKPTAKYCSVSCCAADPVRNERLRAQARKNRRRIIPMTRQMTMGFEANPGAEEQLGRLSTGREDVPIGMSRLAVNW